MPHFASLITDPQNPLLDDRLIERVAAVLPRAGLPDWLSPGVAADIPFVPGGEHPGDLRDIALAELGGAPVDLNFVSTRGRRKRLFLADMDSTMIEQECLDELADLIGMRDHVSAITERAMRGEIAFEPALKERVELFKGLPVKAIERVINERITVMPGARALVATLRAAGVHTALISGGFGLFTGPIAKMIGFDEHRSNVLELDLDGEVLTGTIAPPILGKAGKRRVLLELRECHGLMPADTIAVGDGANDLDMLEEAGLGVAFRAKPAVAAAAGARIDHGDLTALLYLQGYRRDEFAA